VSHLHCDIHIKIQVKLKAATDNSWLIKSDSD